MTTTMHAEVQAEERALRERERNLQRARKVAAKKRQRDALTRPKRLREVEARIDELGQEYRVCTNQRGRDEIRRELRDLGQERLSLRWFA